MPAAGTRRDQSGQKSVRNSVPLTSMRSSALTLLALLLAIPATAKILDAPGVPQVRVEVTRTGDEWRAEFNFDRTVTAWIFPRSALTRDAGKPWRNQTWIVDTRGVRLERKGSYDYLHADRGEVPKR